jgi:hypothetical protein
MFQFFSNTILKFKLVPHDTIHCSEQNILILQKLHALCKPGLPDFSWYNVPQREKMYQITENIPNGHKTYQMAVK